jgi:hypothetical protein
MGPWSVLRPTRTEEIGASHRAHRDSADLPAGQDTRRPGDHEEEEDVGDNHNHKNTKEKH